MGTVLASKIAADAAQLLFDEGYASFSTDDHLKFINDGQRQAVIFKPDVSVNNAAVKLAAGTKQSVSATGIAFIKLTRNMGTGGTTPGKAIYLFDMDSLDIQDPDWHTATAAATVELYMFDPRDSKHFYVSPPQPAADQGYVEQVESITPTDIAAIGSAITIDDIYESTLFHYDLYRALSIDAKQSAQAGIQAKFHYGQFIQTLMGKEMSETNTEAK